MLLFEPLTIRHIRHAFQNRNVEDKTLMEFKLVSYMTLESYMALEESIDRDEFKFDSDDFAWR
jgi:hypothetical protein